jgi:uncharacterized protein YegP (UPF0339 family)
MRSTMFGGFVLAALILFGGVNPDSVSAQAKKEDKAAKKEDKKKDAKAGVIEIAKGKDDKFRFFVRDSEGKLLAMSGPGGFASPKDAEEAIDHLKEVVGKAKVVAKDKDKDKD